MIFTIIKSKQFFFLPKFKGRVSCITKIVNSEIYALIFLCVFQYQNKI